MGDHQFDGLLRRDSRSRAAFGGTWSENVGFSCQPIGAHGFQLIPGQGGP